MSNIIVSFESVSKDFPKVHALIDVTYRLGAGEILGFIGPNGSGKTTAVRLLLGIYTATDGKISVFGRDPARKWRDIGRMVGIALEQPGIDEYLTGREYLDYYGGIFGMSPADVRQRSADVLETVHMSDRADSPLKTYSKGMRQRISIARCLINRPRLIIMDEPFDGLDVETRRMILDILPRIARDEGASIFITSHNLGDLEEISNRIAIIKGGRILAEGSMESLRAQINKRRVSIVKLGHTYSEEEIARLVPDAEYRKVENELTLRMENTTNNHNYIIERLIKAGISVHSISAASPSLEDIYFDITGRVGEKAS